MRRRATLASLCPRSHCRGAAGSAWLYTYTGGTVGVPAYEGWLYLNHACVFYYNSFGAYNSGWTCDW